MLAIYNYKIKKYTNTVTNFNRKRGGASKENIIRN